MTAPKPTMTRSGRPRTRVSADPHGSEEEGPRPHGVSGWNHFDLLICIEYLLDRDVEETGEREGQRK